MQTPTKISVVFCVLVALISPVYYIGLAMLSPGPVDHILIVYVATPLILLHGLLVARYGVAAAAKSAFILFCAIALACLTMRYSMRINPGYSEWLIFRPVVALGFAAMWPKRKQARVDGGMEPAAPRP
ncbi:MAG: hypothetical protein EOP85_14715 [Verrucomicrobiaceae bacterium]|nr:MAG: hypothetical protein EOP85_14715 [Verrucomicrobiaceae bacterium]